MTSRMRSGFSQVHAGVATMLCLGMATAAGAAVEIPATAAIAATAVQKPIEQLELLDEIRVRGKSLAFEISDAEDDFFKLYNKLNKNAQYDVSCGFMNLSGSMIRQRSCVPFFLTTSYTSAPWGGGCSTGYTVINDLYGTQPRYQSGGCFGGSGYTGPSTAALIMHKGADYVDNVIKVINSDQRLVAKVRNLDTLYAELQRVQGRYIEIKGVKAVRTRYVAPPRTQPTARPR